MTFLIKEIASWAAWKAIEMRQRQSPSSSQERPADRPAQPNVLFWRRRKGLQEDLRPD